MRVYTFSEAKRNLSYLLDLAQKDGAVCITCRDGRSFNIAPAVNVNSPLDIKGVDLNLTAEEIVDFVREGRDRH